MFGAQRISFCQGQYKRTRPPFKCWFYHVRGEKTRSSYKHFENCPDYLADVGFLRSRNFEVNYFKRKAYISKPPSKPNGLPELHVKSLFACSICEMELPLWKCNG
ncbi:uncharacterized protein LOC144762776 isoform X2 [Lissotriton helveticus]